MRFSQLLFLSIICFALLVPAIAADNDFTTYKITYDGSTQIKDALASKATTADKVYTLAKASEAVMKELVYPYAIEKTEITIIKSRYDDKMNTVGYWVAAYRGGKEVVVNNPIWIYPAPYQVLVADVYDDKTNTRTYTLKEDPKAAAEGILKMYVGTLPTGKSTMGTSG